MSNLNLLNNLKSIFNILPFLAALLISAICHELGHAYMAYLLGDNTAKDSGRLTINPLKHIDPVGTIIFPILTYVAFKLPLIMFKPVPINERNFRNPGKDGIKVALAGPGTNMLLIIISITILRIFNLSEGLKTVPLFSEWIMPFFVLLILINLILMTFNLMPVPPLDGSWVIRGLLPIRWKYYYQKSYTYLVIIFLILILSGKFHYIFIPVLNFFLKITFYLIK